MCISKCNGHWILNRNRNQTQHASPLALTSGSDVLYGVHQGYHLRVVTPGHQEQGAYYRYATLLSEGVVKTAELLGVVGYHVHLTT